MLKGFPIRLKSELKAIIKEQQTSGGDEELVMAKSHVVVPPNRSTNAWLGASVFSQLTSFNQALVTIEDYAECGARMIHYKCF